MFKLLSKVLYVTKASYSMHLEHEVLVLKCNEDTPDVRIPLRLIETIVVFGNNMISGAFVKACAENGIGISFVSEYGDFFGRFCGKNSGSVFLRKVQYDAYDTDRALIVAKDIIIAKSLNSMNLIKYYSRMEKDDSIANILYEKAEKIKMLAREIDDLNSIEDVRGIESVIATIYFSCFDNMLKSDTLSFNKRSKHPPLNEVNSLLSLFYTLYTVNVTAALETFGLDSQLGVMHRMRCGRASLACDVIEEFRASIVDRFVLKIVNLKQCSSKDFEHTQEGIRLKKDSLKKVLSLWEGFKTEKMYHPYYKKSVEIKVLPYLQAQLLAKYFRGDIEEYPAFFYKLK